MGVLPALVGETLLVGALVFDEAVAVEVAGAVHPAQSRLDRRPQFLDRFIIAGALRIEPGEQDEERRGIDAAVIEAERHLAQRRHLAAAHLVQDFPRLRVGERIGGLGLIGGEPAQHAARDVRAPPQHLQRRDQAVAAERRREPRDAGIGIAALRRIRHQHRQIGRRAAQHFVEAVVRRLDRGLIACRVAQFAMRGNEPLPERQRPGLGPLAAHRQEQRPHLARCEVQVVDRRLGGQAGRPRIESERGAPYLVVEPAIDQQDLIVALQLRARGAAVFAVRSADFEQVGKIIREQNRKPQIDRAAAVIAHAETLIGGVPP